MLLWCTVQVTPECNLITTAENNTESICYEVHQKAMDKVQATCDSARQNPGEENAFRQLRLNQWVKQSIRDISFDRWGAVQNLEGMGFNVVAMGQGFASMFPPTKELMKLTLEQKIAHGGHLFFVGICITYLFVLTWQEILRQINQNQQKRLTVPLLVLWRKTEQSE
jgi:hypothetical protein